MTSSDFPASIAPDFSFTPYTGAFGFNTPPTDRDLPCSTAYFHRIPLPLRRRVLRGCASRFFAPSLAFTLSETLGSLLVPYGVKCRRCRIHLMLRTTVLRLFLRGILRFSTSGYPEAPGDSYVALWQLPRPDFHRLANGDFQGTPLILNSFDGA